jgi:hypothetical protein
MGFLTFLVVVAALAIAILAYQRAGGSKTDLERRLDSLRQKTADTLAKVEKSLRGKKKTEK